MRKKESKSETPAESYVCLACKASECVVVAEMPTTKHEGLTVTRTRVQCKCGQIGIKRVYQED